MMLAKFKPKTFAISRGFLATARLSCRWILALWQVKKSLPYLRYNNLAVLSS